MVELIQVMLPGEERPIRQHLGQDASDRPDVDRLGVSLRIEHDFRCPVPPRGDVLGQEPGVVVNRVRDSGEAKVADL